MGYFCQEEQIEPLVRLEGLKGVKAKGGISLAPGVEEDQYYLLACLFHFCLPCLSPQWVPKASYIVLLSSFLSLHQHCEGG